MFGQVYFFSAICRQTRADRAVGLTTLERHLTLLSGLSFIGLPADLETEPTKCLWGRGLVPESTHWLSAKLVVRDRVEQPTFRSSGSIAV